MVQHTHYATAEELRGRLRKLSSKRKTSKTKKTRVRLSAQDKRSILAKTNGLCHICGDSVTITTFHADHVTPHSRGGTSKLDNFLPACSLCNNYRWFYTPEELQLILKIGVWARTEVERFSEVGKGIGRGFIAKEKHREKRKKRPRQ